MSQPWVTREIPASGSGTNQGCLALLEMWEFQEGLVKGAAGGMIPGGMGWWDRMENQGQQENSKLWSTGGN